MSSIILPSQKGSELNTAEFEANHTRQVAQKTAAYTTVESDNRDNIEVSSATAVTILLGIAADMTSESDTGDYEVTVSNIGAGVVTVARSSTDTIFGATSITLRQYQSATFKVNSAGDGYSLINSQGHISSTFTLILVDDDLTDEGATYTTQTGFYTMVGSLIFIKAKMIVSGVGTLTTTEVARLKGLPFVSNSTADSDAVISGVEITDSTTSTPALGIVAPGTDYLEIHPDYSSSPILVSALALGREYIFTGSYWV